MRKSAPPVPLSLSGEGGLLIGVVAAALLLVTPLAAQRPAGWDAFIGTFDGYTARDSIVGASVAVLRGGRVVARHHYGFGDRALGQRVDSNTIYHWASITKTLTAVAVMQLRDRGRLTLDDNVTRYLPELRQLHDPYGAIDSVTVRMLLGHSGGFQAGTWPYGSGAAWEPFEPTRWEQLVAMMPYQRLEFRPDSRFGYSNPAFIYLARIVEQLTGDAWQTYVYKNLFAPLGLTRSYFAATPYHLAGHRSNNYAVDRDSAGRERVVANGREFDPGITIPNGGWNAPIGDLVRWMAFLAGGTGDQAVLRRSSLAELWRARFPAAEPMATAPVDSVALSFFVLWRHGVRFIGHTGSQAGFRSFFYVNPANGAAVVAAFNTRNDVRPEESAAGFRATRDAALGLIAR